MSLTGLRSLEVKLTTHPLRSIASSHPQLNPRRGIQKKMLRCGKTNENGHLIPPRTLRHAKRVLYLWHVFQLFTWIPHVLRNSLGKSKN